MKKLFMVLLITLIAAQFALPMYLIQRKEKILREGDVFRFKTRPIDPADPFQGRYVRLAYQDDYIPWPKEDSVELDYKARIYVSIETGEDGFSRFTGWSSARPDSGPYLSTRYLGRSHQWDPVIRKSQYKGLRINIPFDRYYMDETKAPRAEVLARDATRSTNCWAEVRILEGKAVIEDVYAEGQSLRVLAAEKE